MTISTLDIETSSLRSGRRVGNTSRMEDFAIERLFAGDFVLCRDHHQNGNSRLANERLFRLVWKRIRDRLAGTGFKLFISKSSFGIQILTTEPACQQMNAD